MEETDNNQLKKPGEPKNNEEVTYFAVTNFRDRRVRFGIKEDDRRRHVYLLGKTGMGKTTMLENMIISDIRAGNGLAVVDPHGDLVEKVVKFIPSERVNDVVYFNPSDVEYPIAFNVLESVNETHKHLVASGLIGVYKKLWADSWGPRMEYILMNSILALIEYPGSTLLGVTRILVDKEYRQKVVNKIKDPVVKSFWVDEYDNYNERFRNEAIAPIQNKVGQFLSSVIIRNIVGQPKSTIDLREIMDQKKILLMNLSKGRIGEDNSALLGAMMITKLQIAAMSRVDVSEEEREDFYLYVDEFQNFSTESFANVLSEARKYRLNLIIAHQYIEQLDEKVRSAVFGNVGTIICFRIGAEDAEFVAQEFAPIFDETDLVNLTKYDTYLKLMIDGVSSDGFSATGLPPVTGETGNEEKVIRVSRERYSKKRSVIEDKIMRWTGVDVVHKATAYEAQPEEEVPISPQITQPSKEHQPAKYQRFEAKQSYARPQMRVRSSSPIPSSIPQRPKVNFLLPEEELKNNKSEREISLSQLPSRRQYLSSEDKGRKAFTANKSEEQWPEQSPPGSRIPPASPRLDSARLANRGELTPTPTPKESPTGKESPIPVGDPFGTEKESPIEKAGEVKSSRYIPSQATISRAPVQMNVKTVRPQTTKGPEFSSHTLRNTGGYAPRPPAKAQWRVENTEKREATTVKPWGPTTTPTSKRLKPGKVIRF